MATIFDVAREAGVSISTVSYALSGKRPIKDSTRERINKAIAALEFRPNAGARMLAGSQTGILALTTPQFQRHAPSHLAFISAIATAAREFDYDVLLLTREEGAEAVRRVWSSSLVDGVIVLDVDAVDDRADVIRELRPPASWIGVPSDPTGLYCVDFNFERAAEMCVERLVGEGHRAIGLIGYSPEIYERGANYALRFKSAVESTAARMGVSVVFTPSDADPASVADSFRRLREAQPPMSATILNCADPVPEMFLGAVGAAGLRAPHDLSVIVVGSVYTTDTRSVLYDHIPWPADVIGRRAVQMTLSQVGAEHGEEVDLVSPAYVEAGTVGPAPLG